jgi:hypothetical protein
MRTFRSALVAVACLAITGCYATVRGPDTYPSSVHRDQSGHPGNSPGNSKDRDDRDGHQDKSGHAQANQGGDRDHD